eukprot:CAMPEP_0170522876 /NCGR_PEP_ID=MMETSP0209-20121228/8278_1 /TAXON_ID=665100 ORGANISM="Litonotus pictus, Strain P1" /NCGR_SAMPLE_ID=MMETSP0209 /ASSEMBLY_ACC=CAM_ASM_000301 /LENGTH=302 /DNA_ID=CAMNT_0010810597 /DNA_START=81 /DNA_END=989 /DNA_ORIENTATION=+
MKDMSSLDEIKRTFFGKSLQKLGGLIYKLDNKLGMESDFGKKYSQHSNSEFIKKADTNIPSNNGKQAEEKQKKEEQNKKGKEESIKTDTNKEKLDSGKEQKKEKAKENKESKEPKEPKEPKQNKKGKDKNDPKVIIETFGGVDLRVGEVEKIIEMEGSENLYHCWVNVGEESLREIGCGLRKFGISKEEFTKEKIVVFSNLKAKKLATIMSNGMILSASKEEKFFELIRPHPDSRPGDSVYLEAEGCEPRKERADFLSANKFTKAKELLKSDEEKNCCFSGLKMRTSSGVITIKELVNCPIS